ncbi:protein of unknown function [Rhodovastum atsumiense]|nr:protein of unknown function [Rhodovastum atsumiense]
MSRPGPSPSPHPPLTPSVQGRHDDRITVEPGLHGTAAQRFIHIVGGTVNAVDRHQLGFQSPAEHPRLGVAGETGHHAAAQCAINMHRPTGENLGPGSNGPKHGHVPLGIDDRLPGPHGAVDHQAGRLLLRRGGRRRRLGGRRQFHRAGRPAAAERRAELGGSGPARLGVLHANDAQATGLQRTRQSQQVGILGRHPAKIQQYGLAVEKDRRARHLCVELRKPLFHWRLGPKHEREKGPAMDAEDRTGSVC